MDIYADTHHSHPRNPIQRVKTGCRTCKIRKVKCDEGRPSCRKCINTGRTCDGYGVWGGGSGFSSREPGAPDGNVAIPPYIMPRLLARLEPLERHSFEWLIHRALVKIPGLYPSDFWQTLVPQICTTEPIILHAALALAAAHEVGLRTQPNSKQSASILNDLEQSILRHYNKAIAQFLLLLTPGNSQMPHLSLVVCLLFTCIEFLRGHYKSGQVHLQTGSKAVSTPSPQSTVVWCFIRFKVSQIGLASDWLNDAIARLHIQASLLGSYYQDPLTEGFMRPYAIPPLFQSLDQARKSLDWLLYQSYKLRHQDRNNLVAHTSTSIQALIASKLNIQIELERWLHVYTLSKPTAYQEASKRDRVAFQVLRVYHIMAHIMVSCVANGLDESIFDQYTADFTSIVERIRNILALAESMTRQAIVTKLASPAFSFIIDMGVIPPLYFTALKCRTRPIRREAIYLLANETRQEGIWNGTLAAAIAEKVVSMEDEIFQLEQGSSWEAFQAKAMQEDNITLDIAPSTGRLYDVHVGLPDTPSGELVLSCDQQIMDGSWVDSTVYYNPVSGNWRSRGFGAKSALLK